MPDASKTLEFRLSVSTLRLMIGVNDVKSGRNINDNGKLTVCSEVAYAIRNDDQARIRPESRTRAECSSRVGDQRDSSSCFEEDNVQKGSMSISRY